MIRQKREEEIKLPVIKSIKTRRKTGNKTTMDGDNSKFIFENKRRSVPISRNH